MIEINYEELEGIVHDKGLPFAEILRRAKVDYKTWYRWKTGVIDPVDRINDILREIEKL